VLLSVWAHAEARSRDRTAELSVAHDVTSPLHVEHWLRRAPAHDVTLDSVLRAALQTASSSTTSGASTKRGGCCTRTRRWADVTSSTASSSARTRLSGSTTARFYLTTGACVCVRACACACVLCVCACVCVCTCACACGIPRHCPIIATVPFVGVPGVSCVAECIVCGGVAVSRSTLVVYGGYSHRCEDFCDDVWSFNVSKCVYDRNCHWYEDAVLNRSGPGRCVNVYVCACVCACVRVACSCCRQCCRCPAWSLFREVSGCRFRLLSGVGGVGSSGGCGGGSGARCG
jgi:hypothetical protein